MLSLSLESPVYVETLKDHKDDLGNWQFNEGLAAWKLQERHDKPTDDQDEPAALNRANRPGRGVNNKDTHLDKNVMIALSARISDEPSFEEAITGPEAEQWEAAYQEEIDSLNILRATHKAMAESARGLGAGFALVDGLPVKGLSSTRTATS